MFGSSQKLDSSLRDSVASEEIGEAGEQLNMNSEKEVVHYLTKKALSGEDLKLHHSLTELTLVSRQDTCIK